MPTLAKTNYCPKADELFLYQNSGDNDFIDMPKFPGCLEFRGCVPRTVSI